MKTSNTAYLKCSSRAPSAYGVDKVFNVTEHASEAQHDATQDRRGGRTGCESRRSRCANGSGVHYLGPRVKEKKRSHPGAS